MRHVVAAAVLLLVLLLQLVEAHDLAVERARGEVREQAGTSIEKLGVWSCSVKPPIWKSENAAGCSVSQSASAAAIFIGCALVTSIAEVAADHMLKQRRRAPRRSARASPPAGRGRRCDRAAKCQQETPNTTIDAEDQAGQDRVAVGPAARTRW